MFAVLLATRKSVGPLAVSPLPVTRWPVDRVHGESVGVGRYFQTALDPGSGPG